jgi:L-2,4-diaminobutyric acid acetyltransferase
MGLSIDSTTLTNNKYVIRNPKDADAAEIWRLVEISDALDHNSFYCYFMLCHFFSSTCAVAFEKNEMVGFVTGFLVPDCENYYFIWQVRVVEKMRGHGIARAMVDFVLKGLEEKVEYIEATISPDNIPSQSLFSSIAAHSNAKIIKIDHFLPTSIFPLEAGIHSREDLFRVGPIVYTTKLKAKQNSEKD